MERNFKHIGSPLDVARAAALVALASIGISAIAAAQSTVPGRHRQAPGPVPAAVPFCFGDGGLAACPCRNTGAIGHGCDNSALTGGAVLSMSGEALLYSDSARLDILGEPAEALTIVFQGDASVRPANFGDGVRCVGGALKRLYVGYAVRGAVSFPGTGDQSISQRSAKLGDPIPGGATRYYQVSYRDPAAWFCPPPHGSSFNATNAVEVMWGK